MFRPDAKTIFLTINYSVNVRDILRGGVLRALRESGHRIVIVTPAHADPDFVREFASDTVIIEPLVVHKPGAIERKFDTFRFTMFPEISSTIRILSTPTRRRTPAKKLFALTMQAVKGALGARLTRKLLQAINVRVFGDRHHEDLFRRYKPDLVCLTEFFHMAPDSWILKRAVQEKIPTLALVHSWDNMTTKGAFPAHVDRLVVWSQRMRQEAATLHGYDPNHVYVGGVPQFDFLTDVAALPTREEFCRRIGADPTKRIITYAMSPLSRSDVELEQMVIERLWELAEGNKFAFPCQILARCYPLRSSAVPPKLAPLPWLLSDIPGRPSPVFTDRDINVDDLRHLAATMRYSDVVVNLASTITIDAAVCGTPAVCVGFDEVPDKPYLQSVRRYYDFAHYQSLLSTGGVHVAKTMDELVERINAYMENKDLHKDARQRILDMHCDTLDGRAGARIGAYVLQYLDEVTRAR